MSQGAPTRASCDMCAYSFDRVLATQDIIYGGKGYSVCDEHAANPIPDPNRPDFGPAPHNGTETSEKSAQQSDKDVTPQAYLVLGVITAAGPSGLVREEIYKIAKITNQAACARLNLLKTKGLVVVDGERYVPDTRRTQGVYKLAIYAQARAAA